MLKPAILTVDDDPEVLRAIESDLRKRFVEHYRILRANSGATALETLKQLHMRNAPVALLLTDQRMPHMGGIDFLREAMKIYPDAKRALLTAYADTEAAIRAINEVMVNHYLMKPWEPPEQNFYPVIEDMLQDWQAAYRPPFEGVRVIGNRWCPDCYRVRDFLARYHIPYHWLDIEAPDQQADAKRLLKSIGSNSDSWPLVLFPDGECLSRPTDQKLAGKLKLHTKADTDFYDLVIIGGGPAGLAAAVYGASEGLNTVLVDREAPGGQAGLSSRIENYLGFPTGLSGSDLARRAVAQARRFGVEILSPCEATAIRVDGPYRYVKLNSTTEISSHVVLIATGVQWRRLDLPGLDRLLNAGIYYGASSAQALACKDEDVYVVGGANSAGQAAMNFSLYARRVVMLVRGNSLSSSMSQYLITQIKETPNIQVEFGTTVTAVNGDGHLESITLHCAATGDTRTIPASALFIFIGAVPRTEWLDGVVERDELGFVLSGRYLMRDGRRPLAWQLSREPWLLETSVPGIFVAGDVRHSSVKRVASGVGEGSIAVQFIHQYLGQI